MGTQFLFRLFSVQKIWRIKQTHPQVVDMAKNITRSKNVFPYDVDKHKCMMIGVGVCVCLGFFFFNLYLFCVGVRRGWVKKNEFNSEIKIKFRDEDIFFRGEVFVDRIQKKRKNKWKIFTKMYFYTSY